METFRHFAKSLEDNNCECGPVFKICQSVIVVLSGSKYPIFSLVRLLRAEIESTRNDVGSVCEVVTSIK